MREPSIRTPSAASAGKSSPVSSRPGPSRTAISLVVSRADDGHRGPIELADQAEVAEDRRIAPVIDPGPRLRLDDEAERRPGDYRARRERDCRPVVGFDRTDNQAGNLDDDPPNRCPDLGGGQTAVEQKGPDVGATDHGCARPRRDGRRVSEMVGRAVGHEDDVGCREIIRAARRSGVAS